MIDLIQSSNLPDCNAPTAATTILIVSGPRETVILSVSAGANAVLDARLPLWSPPAKKGLGQAVSTHMAHSLSVGVRIARSHPAVVRLPKRTIALGINNNCQHQALCL